MEEVEWKRDETPYIVFPCKKCRQFMYVKQTQKTKKCPRCGRSHKVSDIENCGEIVNGMTAAVEAVKEKQHELAIKELGTTPQFRAFKDFQLKTSPKTNREKANTSKKADDYLPKFKKMLIELENLYSEVPDYIFEIFAENYNIPESEVKILIRLFQKKGVIIPEDGNMYRINFNALFP